MAATGVIGAKRQKAREEFLAQLQTLADKAGFEFDHQKTETEFQGAKAQPVLGEMAQARVNLVLAQIVADLTARIEKLEAAHASASTKRAK